MTDNENAEEIVYSDLKVTWTEPDEDGVGQRTAEIPGTFTFRRTTDEQTKEENP